MDKYTATDDAENLRGLKGLERMKKSLELAAEKNSSSGFCELRIKKEAVPKEWKNGVDFQPSGVVTVAAAPTKKDNVYTIPLSDPDNKIDSLACVGTKSLAEVLYTLRMGNVSRIKYDKPTREALSLSSTDDARFDLNSAKVTPGQVDKTKVTTKIVKQEEPKEEIRPAAPAKKATKSHQSGTDREPAGAPSTKKMFDY